MLDDLFAPTVPLLASPAHNPGGGIRILSARGELIGSRHLVTVLQLCANVPDDAGYAYHDQANDGRVGFPVCRL